LTTESAGVLDTSSLEAEVVSAVTTARNI